MLVSTIIYYFLFWIINIETVSINRQMPQEVGDGA